MLLKRFYDEPLAQASYLVGCEAAGEAVVIDANRDVEQYVAAARAEGVRISHVTETHIHADYVSGSRELAKRTGATLLLSGEGGRDWSYAFAQDDGAVLLKDGDSLCVGNVRLDVMHTPGHTPEHLSFMVTDTAATSAPMGVFTGDFVFVGDVGRPDLLERAAKVAGTMVEGARTLYRSLRRFRSLPDHLQLWPGHGAGSACGKALGAVPQSTLGYEKLVNWGLAETSEEEFVRAVLDGQPEPPRYFAEMKRVNRDGPRLLGGLTPPPHLPPDALPAAIADGAVVIDARPGASFAAGHVPGTLGIPFARSFATRAGSIVPYDRDIYLVIDDGVSDALAGAARSLALIGLDRLRGYFDAAAVDAWRASSGSPLQTVAQISARELASRRAAGEPLAVIDVRGRAEWESGHLPGAPNIPLGALAGRVAELPRDRPIVLHCQGGSRSLIAAGLLQSLGLSNVVNLAGGFTEWQAQGGEVATGGTEGLRGRGLRE